MLPPRHKGMISTRKTEDTGGWPDYLNLSMITLLHSGVNQVSFRLGNSDDMLHGDGVLDRSRVAPNLSLGTTCEFHFEMVYAFSKLYIAAFPRLALRHNGSLCVSHSISPRSRRGTRHPGYRPCARGHESDRRRNGRAKAKARGV